MTLLADVVTASQEVTGTSSRSKKVAILAELLGRLEPSEVGSAVGFLAGAPRQGRVGVGYSTIYGIDCAPAPEPSIAIGELDRAIEEVQDTTGSGSAGERRRILTELLSRATEDEADFVKRLFTGGLRQGALAGLMIDAIAKAAGVSGVIARRALMLSGDLSRTAEIAMTEGEEGLREVGFELFRPIFPMLASTAASAAEAGESFERSGVWTATFRGRTDMELGFSSYAIFAHHDAHYVPWITAGAVAMPQTSTASTPRPRRKSASSALCRSSLRASCFVGGTSTTRITPSLVPG